MLVLKDCPTRISGRTGGLQVQAKVCAKCGQLVLTYRESLNCIVCGGILKQVKKGDQSASEARS